MIFDRSAGILLPIFSLPSNYGIGTLGQEAYDFVDFLQKARQSYWQNLPVSPTSYGDSPYQSFSSFAGNPYFIDLDILCEEGMLEKADLKKIRVEDPRFIDYGWLYENRFGILYKAYMRGMEKYHDEYLHFCQENAFWLADYALFMAVKKHFDMLSWLEWPDQEIRLRKKEALEKYRLELADDINFYQFMQFLFDRQYLKLKDYANSKGIRIIGDLPIYIALDSADVWSNPEQFQLDEESKVPKEVAGVPPDYFSKNGQLWGNPLYDWKYMKQNGYKWWIERIGGVRKYFDVIRIDHFRGFHEYWCVRYGEKTAKNGHWAKGPDMDFISVLQGWFNDVEFIAEDLGIINDGVRELLKNSAYPGMRVLQFALDENGKDTHYPHNHVENCICYVGTHDNPPIMGFLKSLKKKNLKHLKDYYGLNEEEGYNYGFIRGGMSSIARLFVCSLADYLGLDETATINVPGTMGNWKWRLLKGEYDDKLAEKIAHLTRIYHREGKILK